MLCPVTASELRSVTPPSFDVGGLAVPLALTCPTNPSASRVPPPLGTASGGGLHPISGPRAVYGKLTNRSRKSKAFVVTSAAPPSIGVVTLKISCIVRSVELWW